MYLLQESELLGDVLCTAFIPAEGESLLTTQRDAGAIIRQGAVARHRQGCCYAKGLRQGRSRLHHSWDSPLKCTNINPINANLRNVQTTDWSLFDWPFSQDLHCFHRVQLGFLLIGSSLSLWNCPGLQEGSRLCCPLGPPGEMQIEWNYRPITGNIIKILL